MATPPKSRPLPPTNSPAAPWDLSDFITDCRKRQLVEHYMHAYNPALAFELGILPADAPWMETLPEDKREATMRAKLTRMAYNS